MRKLALILFTVLTLVQFSRADIAVTEGSGKTVKTTTSGGKEVQWIQIDSSSNTVSNSGTFAVQASQSGAFVITGTTVGVMDAGGSLTVDNAGTFAVQAAQSGAYIITQSTVGVVGVAASSTTASGNPVLVGIVASTGPVTPVGIGSIVNRVGDRWGRTITVGELVSFASSSGTAVTVSTAAAPLIPAPGAGRHLRIKYASVTNSGSTATIVAFREGTTGALRYEAYLPQGGLFAHNLRPDYWDLATNTSFSLYSSAAGNVYWTVEYVNMLD